MKRARKFLTLAVISALLCGCGQTELAGTSNNAETSVELTVTTTEIAVTEEITTTTEVTTTPETTTNSETEETEETVTEKSAETTELTTVLAEETIETTTETTTIAETTATTTTVTTAATTVTTTTPEATTTPKTKKTKKTKKTTTTPEETATPETTEVTTTTEPPEIIPESGIYTAEDGTLYVEGNAYEMTFEDEFEGDSLDLSKWEYCPEWKRQDLECYWENDCTSVKDGKLVLTSEYRDGKYYMGAVRSKGKFEQAYGYFEVKCTLNTIPGYWSAFWLMSESVVNENNSGVDGTEIDIMESAYYGKALNHGLHWDGYGANHRSSAAQTENSAVYDGNYHTFSLLWTESEYIFYIDGEEVWRTAAEEAGGVSTAPSYLKFTTETGSWTATQLDEERFPDNVYVEYIRAYSKSE